VTLGGLGACAHDEVPSAIPSNEISPAPAASPPNARMGSTMLQSTAPPAGDEPMYGPQSPMIPGGWGLPPDLSGLGDGQLVGVVQAVHQADIEHLQLALLRSSSSELLGFARDAIQVHRAAERDDDAEVAQLKLTPSVSPTSQQVLADWQRDRSSVDAASAAEFDRRFIDHHVTLDTKAVALLDAAIANARNGALKGYLQSDRASLAGHMREAQRVQMSLRARMQ
jgi:predicted outer membrane protein